MLHPAAGCDGIRRPSNQSAPVSAARERQSRQALLKQQHSTRFAWPVCTREHAGFGYRVDEFTGSVAFHSGEDFKGPLGAPVRAPHGLMVEIDHGRGFRTRYGHLLSVSVEPGDMIGRGQVIAKMGSSGRASGPHLHFEIWLNNVVRDPLKFLERDPACWRD